MGKTKQADKLKFKCTWPNCGYEFQFLQGRTQNVSAQAKCPNCGMFIPLDEGK